MKTLYVYDKVDKSLVAEVTGITADDCEAVARKHGYEQVEWAWAYTQEGLHKKGDWPVERIVTEEALAAQGRASRLAEIEAAKDNTMFVHYDKFFVTMSDGAGGDPAHLHLQVVFPQFEGNIEALKVEEELFSELFGMPVNSFRGFALRFASRRDFARFPSIFRYVHQRGGHLVLANFGRNFLNYDPKYNKASKDYRGFVEPGNAPDDRPEFWAVVAAAQMYYGQA